MQFPEWAPRVLIDQLDFSTPGQQGEERAKSRQRERLKENPVHAGILRSLLVAPDMERAWKALRRPPSVRFQERCNEKGVDWFHDISVPHALWTAVLQAIETVKSAIRDGRTRAQQRHDLLQIAKAAEQLSAAISEERRLHRTNREAVLFALEHQNETSSIHRKIYPDDQETGHIQRFGPRRPLAYQISKDISRAKNQELLRREAYTALNPRSEYFQRVLERRRLQGSPVSPREIPWPDKIPEDRVLAWAERALRLNMTDILAAFSEDVRVRAARRVDVPQPNRGMEGLRPVLIRRLFDFTYEYFDQPLDDVVAIVASTVLGKEIALDRGDVKQYRRRVKVTRPTLK